MRNHTWTSVIFHHPKDLATNDNDKLSRSSVDISLPVTGVTNPGSEAWSNVASEHMILFLPEGRVHAKMDQEIIRHIIARGLDTMLPSPGQLWDEAETLLKKEKSCPDLLSSSQETWTCDRYW